MTDKLPKEPIELRAVPPEPDLELSQGNVATTVNVKVAQQIVNQAQSEVKDKTK